MLKFEVNEVYTTNRRGPAKCVATNVLGNPDVYQFEMYHTRQGRLEASYAYYNGGGYFVQLDFLTGEVLKVGRNRGISPIPFKSKEDIAFESSMEELVKGFSQKQRLVLSQVLKIYVKGSDKSSTVNLPSVPKEKTPIPASTEVAKESIPAYTPRAGELVTIQSLAGKDPDFVHANGHKYLNQTAKVVEKSKIGSAYNLVTVKGNLGIWLNPKNFVPKKTRAHTKRTIKV